MRQKNGWPFDLFFIEHRNDAKDPQLRPREVMINFLIVFISFSHVQSTQQEQQQKTKNN